jgi:endonuclease/exonuclease/phosphatase (EEP) superfamily protein YafD
MRLWKIIATATVAEGAAIAAFGSLAGLGGAFSGWLDLLNNLAPVWFGIAVLAAPVAAALMAPGRAKGAVVGLAIFAGVISGAQVLPELVQGIGPLAHGRRSAAPLKIVTFNTWSDNDQVDKVADLIRRSNPDAVALIEMSWPLAHAQPAVLADDYPYRTKPKHGCPPDMIIISKRRFSAYGCQITIAPSRPDLTETIVWGRTTAPDGRPFTLATTHYAWPIPHGGQEMQRPALVRFVRSHAGEDLILTGDFNLTPWTFALRRQDHDLRPLTRRDHAIVTWPAMFARLQKPTPFPILPIDHIYAGPAWRTTGMRRLARAGSDHYGIEATFSRR